MSTRELLWTIREERRRQAAAIQRERLGRRGDGGATFAGRLVGWLRDRLRARRDAIAGSTGWTLAR